MGNESYTFDMNDYLEDLNPSSEKTILAFLKDTLIPDLRKIVKNGFDFYAFLLICSGIELLGSFFDQKELSEPRFSEKRIKNAIKNLFPKPYKDNNIKTAIIESLRNSIVHQFRPTGNIALTSNTSSRCPGKHHLRKPLDKDDKRIVLVIENFIDDLEAAVKKLEKEKDNKLKEQLNPRRLSLKFLYTDTIRIGNGEVTLSADTPYMTIESKSI